MYGESIGESLTGVIWQSGLQETSFSPVQAATLILDLHDVKQFRIKSAYKKRDRLLYLLIIYGAKKSLA